MYMFSDTDMIIQHMLYIHCISSGKELVNSHNLHKYHKGFHKVVRCFSNVFTNILFASEVPTIPSRYAVNLIKGNREAWMHRIGSLLLRDSMGHQRHAASCTIPALYHDSCSISRMFFFGSLMVTVELPQMFLFSIGWFRFVSQISTSSKTQRMSFNFPPLLLRLPPVQRVQQPRHALWGGVFDVWKFKFENVCQKIGFFWRWKEREKVLDLEG